MPRRHRLRFGGSSAGQGPAGAEADLVPVIEASGLASRRVDSLSKDNQEPRIAPMRVAPMRLPCAFLVEQARLRRRIGRHVPSPIGRDTLKLANLGRQFIGRHLVRLFPAGAAVVA